MAILDDTRADWNARPPLRERTVVPWADRIGVSWHWIGPGKGPSATGPHSACLAQVRDWQLQHQANGWKDIGYNALVCQHARAIEGRGLTYSGSHSPGVNTVHVGIQFMVGDATGFPNAAMIARAVKLRADVGQLGSNIRRDWAHRDDKEASTSCPGNALTDWVHSGGPTKNAPTQEDDVTPQDIKDIADEILKRPVKDYYGNDTTVGIALGVTLRNSTRAALDATAALEVAKAQALKGEALTADEVKAAVKAALAEKVSIELVVKPDVP